MLSEDEDAVICDFAETYHVLDLYSLPVNTAATLAEGLRENSRIRMKLAGIKSDYTTYLLMSILDALRVLVWAKTKDAKKGRNQPKSYAKDLLIKSEDENIAHYDSFKEFDDMRRKILG